MILVTGGTGLVGSHLLYRLSIEYDQIVAIHRESSDLEVVKHVFSYYTDKIEDHYTKIIWKEADITDISTLKDVFKHPFKHVYHCAAMISFNAKDYYQLRSVNIKGTANLVNLSLENAIEKFCFVSSIATLDEQPNQSVITEENEWNPELKHHGYAITKYGGEMEVWRASQEGLNVLIINPGVILGSGLWKSGSGKLFSSIANGFNYYTVGITGFVDVLDVVKSMVVLMKSSFFNERFILVSKNCSFKEVLFQIADDMAVNRPSIKVGKAMAEIAWRLDWFKGLFVGHRNLTKHTARSGLHSTNYSSEKIRNKISFNFLPIGETIKRICTNYRQEQ